MMDLQWPPRTQREMKAWQNRYGHDEYIARAARVTESVVKHRRLGWKLPIVPRPKRRPYGKATFARFRRPLTEAEIARVYDGQRYEDVRLKA